MNEYEARHASTGFGGIATASWAIAKTLFVVFVVVADIAMIVGLVTGRNVVP